MTISGVDAEKDNLVKGVILSIRAALSSFQFLSDITCCYYREANCVEVKAVSKGRNIFEVEINKFLDEDDGYSVISVCKNCGFQRADYYVEDLAKTISNHIFLLSCHIAPSQNYQNPY